MWWKESSSQSGLPSKILGIFNSVERSMSLNLLKLIAKVAKRKVPEHANPRQGIFSHSLADIIEPQRIGYVSAKG